MQFYRHGDIGFRPAEKIPKGAKTEERSSYIVAYGEATGHHHELRVPVAPKKKAKPTISIHTCADGRRFVELNYGTALDHPEHGLLTLEKGVYEIIQERERDPFESAIRRVID